MVLASASLGSSSSLFAASRPARTSRGKCSGAARNDFRCSLQDEKVAPGNNRVPRKLLSCLAASLVFITPPSQAIPAETFAQPSLCQVAVVAAIDKDAVPLKFDGPSDDGMMMMMKGMTAKNFDPVRYSGRWFEVASLKRGFAGQGQEDCHCTQGVYSFDEKSRAIKVETFCVHGSPDGYITGIRGRVQCLSEEDMASAETDLEREEMIRTKCFLRFPTLPFIPKLPYDVLATDYDNYAVVSGAKDTSFIQIYSRTPNPGPEFIEKYKSYAANFGYDPSKIKDTPQDCDVSSDQLAQMMSMPGMNEALTNQFPDLKLKGSVTFDPFTSVSETLKKLVELYFNHSSKFRAGGYDWCIMFYPDGINKNCAGNASAFLQNLTLLTKNVRTKFTLNMLEKEGKVPLTTFRVADAVYSSPARDALGYVKFVEKSKLKSSSDLDPNGYFTIRCILTVIEEPRSCTECKRDDNIVVPPLELPGHLERMLKGGRGADVTFDVGGQVIRAHKSILAARSPVFDAQLYGPMMERDTQHIKVVDMEPIIFEMLLHFIYTDSLPACDGEGHGAAVMQHLMVAADRYGLDRLKLMCEEKLCGINDVKTVTTTLALADQHGCRKLKDACLKFMSSPRTLSMIVATDGFKHLMASCPRLALEESLVDKLSVVKK